MSLLRRPILTLVMAAGVVVALAMFTNVLPYRQIVDQRQEIEAAQAHLDELRASNGSLASQIDALNTPLEIERLARDQLGYVRPGERAYVVLEPDPTPRVYAEDFEEPQAGSQPEPPWYERLWNYVTGRDLVR